MMLAFILENRFQTHSEASTVSVNADTDAGSEQGISPLILDVLLTSFLKFIKHLHFENMLRIRWSNLVIFIVILYSDRILQPSFPDLACPVLF